MNDPQPLVQFPVPSTATLVVLAILVVGILAFAVAAEVYRRSKIRQARLGHQWRSVYDILRDRNVTGNEAETLERMIRRHMPREPLKAVTTRDGFGELVQREMDSRAKDEARHLEQFGIKLHALRAELGLDYVPVGHSLHSTRELHDGQWISMAPAGDKEPRWVRVMVEDVNEAFFYVVLKDRSAGDIPRIQAGETVHCHLWREEDARYVFDTTVAAFDDPPPTWRLYHTIRLARTQTRAHFRVRHDQPVLAGVLNAPLNKEETDVKSRPTVTKIPGRITSLSAGGCAIVFNQAVARHVLLRITLELTRSHPLEVELEIVAASAISGGRYLVRGKFLGLSEETRDKIARYVLHKQQQRLAKQTAKG